VICPVTGRHALQPATDLPSPTPTTTERPGTLLQRRHRTPGSVCSKRPARLISTATERRFSDRQVRKTEGVCRELRRTERHNITSMAQHAHNTELFGPSARAVAIHNRRSPGPFGAVVCITAHFGLGVYTWASARRQPCPTRAIGHGAAVPGRKLLCARLGLVQDDCCGRAWGKRPSVGGTPARRSPHRGGVSGAWPPRFGRSTTRTT
jgi:hypothetical protein